MLNIKSIFRSFVFLNMKLMKKFDLNKEAKSKNKALEIPTS